VQRLGCNGEEAYPSSVLRDDESVSYLCSQPHSKRISPLKWIVRSRRYELHKASLSTPGGESGGHRVQADETY
jgi:hypothetical protein